MWRSTDAGATWTQINPSLNPADANMRPEFAVTTLASGQTRMYIHEGAGTQGGPLSRLFRSDNVATGAPVFTNLQQRDRIAAVAAGQCWCGSSFTAGQDGGSTKWVGPIRTDRGSRTSVASCFQPTLISATDMTMDGTDPIHPNGLHPDQHALVTNPANPFQFFEVNDGGLMRSSGLLTDVSNWCDGRGITNADQLARCRQLLSRVPTKLESMNQGIATLQFQSVSVSPFNSNIIQGGTQDNGTWQTREHDEVEQHDDWRRRPVWIRCGESGLPFPYLLRRAAGRELQQGRHGRLELDRRSVLYPAVQRGTALVLHSHHLRPDREPVDVCRPGSCLAHQEVGDGAMSLADFREQWNEWFGEFTVICGDWQPLGDPTTAGRLTDTAYGADGSGGFVVAVERAVGNATTLWAATQTGRVFISTNANADPAAAVAFTRLDSLALNDPNRFVSGIHIDPTNPNRGVDLVHRFQRDHTLNTRSRLRSDLHSGHAGFGNVVGREPRYRRHPGHRRRARRCDGRPLRGDRLRRVPPGGGHDRLGAGCARHAQRGSGGTHHCPECAQAVPATHGLSGWLLNLPK